MAITVTGKKIDVVGDPGYVLEIANRTDAMVWVYSGTEWTVGGKEVQEPVLLESVGSGQTVEAFLWFDHEGSGIDSLDELVAVEGDIVVMRDPDSDVIGSYKFKM